MIKNVEINWELLRETKEIPNIKQSTIFKKRIKYYRPKITKSNCHYNTMINSEKFMDILETDIFNLSIKLLLVNKKANYNYEEFYLNYNTINFNTEENNLCLLDLLENKQLTLII